MAKVTLGIMLDAEAYLNHHVAAHNNKQQTKATLRIMLGAAAY
jgi:hypothetical protein